MYIVFHIHNLAFEMVYCVGFLSMLVQVLAWAHFTNVSDCEIGLCCVFEWD